jgi:hypothetical protein
MAVHGIGQAHLSQLEPTSAQVTSRAQNAATKNGAADTTERVPANQSTGTPAAAAAENNAGREQGQR